MRTQNLKPAITPIAAALVSRRLPRWAALTSILAPGLAVAGPTGGQVIAGQAAISTPDALTTVVDQSSQAAILHWQQFDVGGQEYVIFNQPNASAAVLNRVLGGNPSEILGHLQSNGRVYLVNPQGVMFGQGARLDVGSLVATTLDIANQDFLQGNHVFSNPGSGSIENQGHIQAAEGGFVVLAADAVRNTGVIAARLGDVVLASGSQMTLDLNGDGLVNFKVNQASLSDRAGLTNVGDLIAQGGSVIMNAQTARQLMGAAVNNSGRVTASGIEERGGEIWLTAGGTSADVLNTGKLEADGAPGTAAGAVAIRASGDVTLAGTSVISATGRDGGTVRAVAGERLTHAQGSRIDVGRTALAGRGGFAELSGAQISIRDIVRLGGGGRLLIDPASVTIGTGGDIEESVLESQLQSASAGDQVQIIASERITLLNLTDDRLDGQSVGGDFDTDPDPLYGGSLLLGIGTVDPDAALNVNAGFTRGDGVVGGGIFFDDANDAIQIDGNLDLLGGNLEGNILIGGLVSRNGYVNVSAPGGTVSIGRVVDAVAGAVDVFAEGDIHLQGVFGQAGVDLISTAGGVTAGGVGSDGGGKVYITAVGDVELMNAAGNEIYITTPAEVRTVLNGRNNGESNPVDITGLYTLGDDNGIYVVGGSLDLGNINSPNPLFVGQDPPLSLTTVALTANAGSVVVGDVNASRFLSIDAAGGISTGTLDVSSVSSGDQEQVGASVNLHANRNIGLGPTGGSLTVTGSVTTRTIGQHLDNSTNNQVSIINGDFLASGQDESIYSGGAITVTGVINNLHTPTGTGRSSSSVVVEAHNGFDLSVNNIDPGDGSIRLETGRNTDGITVGNIIAGALDPGLGSDLTLDSAGTLSLTTTTFTAGDIEISSGVGDLTLGALTATSGSILVESAGDLTLTGDASYTGSSSGQYLDAYIELTAGGDLDIQDVTVDVTATGDGSSAYSGIYLSARGGISTGDLSASASTTGLNSFSDAQVYVTANDAYQIYDSQTQSYLPPLGGDLETGSVTLSSTATGAGSDADAYLYVENESSITVQTQDGPQTQSIGGSVTMGPVSVMAEDNGSVYYGGDAYASIEALGNITIGFDADTQTSSGDFIQVTASGSPDKYAILDIDSESGAVITSAITVTGEYEGSASIDAGGGAIEVRGDVRATGGTYSYIGLRARGGITAGLLDARSLGDTDNNYISADIDAEANYLYYYDGQTQTYLPALGGNIVLSGANARAVGQQLTISADAEVELTNYGPVSDTSGKIIVNGSIEAVSTATAYDQAATECGGCTTYSDANVDLEATGDITVTGTTTISATGAGSTADGGETTVPADSNYADLYVVADYQYTGQGSDINLADISLSDGGTVALYAATADDSEETVDRGTITIGTLSASSGSLDHVYLESHGSTTLNNASISAGSIDIRAGSLVAPNAAAGLALTALRGGVSVQTRDGDLTLGDVSATAGEGFSDAVSLASEAAYAYDYYDYYGGVFINAAGGNLTTGDVTATGNGYGATIQLSALGGVTVNGDLTATDTGNANSSYYTPYAFIQVQANAWQYSYTQAPLGGDIIINGSTRAEATGVMGDPSLNSASARVALLNNTNYYEIFDPQTESYDSHTFYGGGIRTGAVSAIATGLPHDETNFPGSLSYAEAEVDIYSNRDFTSNGNDITASATGADQNQSSVEIGTAFGGDITANKIMAANGGSISLTAFSDETGQNLGNIDVHEVSGGTAAPSLSVSATGDIQIDILPADDIIMTSVEGDIVVGDLNTQNGRIDIEAYNGGISTGNLSTNRGGIFLDAAGYISTGSLSTDDDGVTGLDTGIYLNANRDFSAVDGGSAPLGGDISINGSIHSSGPVELRNPGGSIFLAPGGQGGLAATQTVLASTLGAGLLAQARDSVEVSGLTLDAEGHVDLSGALVSLVDSTLSAGSFSATAAGGSVTTDFMNLSATGTATFSGATVEIFDSTITAGTFNATAPDLDLTSVTVNAGAFTLSGGGGTSSGGISLNNVCLNDFSHGCVNDGGPAALSGTGLVEAASIDINGLFTGTSTLSLRAGSSLTVVLASIESGSATMSSGGSISLQGSFEGDLTAEAGGALVLGPTSIFSGANGSFSANAIDVLSSDLLYSGTLSLDTTEGPQTTAGGSTPKATSPGDIVFTDAFVEAGRLEILASGGISGNGSFAAAALDARGSFIDFSAAALSIGSGQSLQGIDPDLITQLALDVPGLLPASLSPNAALVSASDVRIGNLSMQGDYLFVKADSVTVDNLVAPNGLLFNFTPTSNTAALNLDTAIDVDGQSLDGVSFALGSSDYTGDISLTETVDFRPDAVNVLFFTEGTVTGAENILSNGRVLVLGAIVVPPPSEQVQRVVDQVNNIDTALVREQQQDDEDEGGEYEGTDSGTGDEDLVEQKSQDDDGKLECT